MKTVIIILLLASIIAFSCTNAKIGYFWHITDFHYNPLYSSQGDIRKNCRRLADRGSSRYLRALGKYGDYACDSSLELIESAAKYMRTRHSDNVEFVLWTGDIVTSHYTLSEDDRLNAIRNMTFLLSRTFSSHFVFPVLGDLDPKPSETVTTLWMQWLPLEALETFANGGYYTIEQKQNKLRLVILNTNLFGIREHNTPESSLQWEWLSSVFNKADKANEMIYIIGHTAPGTEYRHGHEMAVGAVEKYIRMVRQHARRIAGQFFGHLHTDTFRIFYDNERPVSWALLAPSVTPHRYPNDASNPGLRLYKFDTHNGKVLDYTQYYLDLKTANRNIESAQWTVEYNVTLYYGLHDITATSLHNLADRIRTGTTHDNSVLKRYLRAYKVKFEESENCDSACAHQHYCSITCLDLPAYQQCLDSASSALATAADSAAIETFPLKAAIALTIFAAGVSF
ncbi:acid sphingomyelinase-like phosphodiesterase 3b [Bombyx mori]|uniref:Acid sphingomyelinase-like phosphodiesterase 3b n=1 Tax=Bombyx mori TaxID=7091 RepID=A0A8R2DNR3_BOMMO|nr:acid sphingomyelinase-like phosphodiesterase 3b [Bombyx mori]